MKKCTKCLIEKTLDKFGDSKYSKDKKNYECKECRNKIRIDWYYSHKEKHKEWQKNAQLRCQEFVLEFKSQNPCIHCRRKRSHCLNI